ncbi:unnamed protein product [Blepharisma stoltei]|uniref:beta-glucosidase n=1 Tax=Blepharisma stoltei TaxID=1481888 RepID=A0AAU9K2K8_9CILI|nr:unnamed protein product [Blepharisma stoltei]
MIIFLSPILILATFATQFPEDFAWGTGIAAFQVEGAWNESGKGMSMWDYFQEFPGRIRNNYNAKVAADFYHRYPEDIELMKKLGIKHLRLSISWPRILPTGLIDSPNPEGVKFYRNLFGALLNAGITPYVTLYHWDLPQTFNNFTDKSTWLNKDIVFKFNDYADFCFKNFGDQVKFWITFNEIKVMAWVGYGTGLHAPGRCSPNFGSWCKEIGGGGNSSTEPYIVAHHAFLAHGYAVKTYREKYQKLQGGKIGMASSSTFALPYDNQNIDDINAAHRAVAFQFGWLTDPIAFGRYPEEMSSIITGNRLPNFTESESEMLKGSYDFLGFNYYTTQYAQHTGIPGINYISDPRIKTSAFNKTGNLIGPFTNSWWVNAYAPGFRDHLNWIKKRYNDPDIYILENGISCWGEHNASIETGLNDACRVNYVHEYIMSMIDAIVLDKIKVKGYFLWSLIDNFEWADGFDGKFGITYVDYAGNLTRTVKNSGYMYKALLEKLGSSSLEEVKQILPANLVDIGKARSK